MFFRNSIIQWLDYMIIEEEDGSANVIKNRYDGHTGILTAEEYSRFKNLIRDYAITCKELVDMNEKALAAGRQRRYKKLIEEMAADGSLFD